LVDTVDLKSVVTEPCMIKVRSSPSALLLRLASQADLVFSPLPHSTLTCGLLRRRTSPSRFLSPSPPPGTIVSLPLEASFPSVATRARADLPPPPLLPSSFRRPRLPCVVRHQLLVLPQARQVLHWTSRQVHPLEGSSRHHLLLFPLVPSKLTLPFSPRLTFLARSKPSSTLPKPSPSLRVRSSPEPSIARPTRSTTEISTS